MAIDIRPATIDDSEALNDLSRRTIDSSYRAFLGDEGVDGFIGSGEIERFIEESIGRTLVIVAEERVVGYAATEAGMVTLLMIDSNFHKLGYGSLLLDHVEKELFLTFEELTLESFEHNAVANVFYKKHGWSEVRKFVNEEYQIEMVTLKKKRPDGKGHL